MPILLQELLKLMENEKKDGLVHIEDWRLPEVDYLFNMGFEFEDDYRMSTPKEPHIVVYKKEETDNSTGKKSEAYFIEEPNKSIKKIKDFKDVINFFDTYSQPILDKRR